jgi:hypothetical protein
MITYFIRTHKPLMFLLLSILLLIVLRLPSISEPNWYDDEGIHAGVANQIVTGGELYVNGWDNKPPFMYLLNAVYIQADQAQLLLRGTSILFSIGTMVLIYLISKKVSEGRVLYLTTFLSAILLGLPFLENNIANAENFFILFTSFGIYFALKKKYILTALFYGFAIFTKAQPTFEFISIFPVILIFLIQSKEKAGSIVFKLFKGALLFVLPLLLTAIYFLSRGHFSEFADSVLLSNFSYVGEAAEVTKFLFFENSVYWRLLVLVIVVGFISYRYFKGKLRYDHTLIFVWLAGALFGAALSGRGYPHYLLQAVPPFICTIAVLFSGKLFSKNTVGNGLILVALTAIYLAYFFQGRGFPYHLNYNTYYQTGYGFLLGDVSREEWNNFFTPKMKYMYEISSYIDAMTVDGEYIYAVDHSGWIYVLSHTKSASRYVAYYHLWHTENRTQEAIEEIKNNNPRYIVVNKNEEVFKELQEYIDSNYVKELYGTEEYVLWGRKQ